MCEDVNMWIEYMSEERNPQGSNTYAQYDLWLMMEIDRHSYLRDKKNK